jgi:hypothetical protein
LYKVKKKPHIYTYLLFENDWSYQRFIETYKIEDYPHVVIDKNGKYLTYMSHFKNGKLIYMEKGTIIKEVEETLENEIEINGLIEDFQPK